MTYAVFSVLFILLKTFKFFWLSYAKLLIILSFILYKIALIK